jgi:hypothetical protein
MLASFRSDVNLLSSRADPKVEIDINISRVRTRRKTRITVAATRLRRVVLAGVYPCSSGVLEAQPLATDMGRPGHEQGLCLGIEGKVPPKAASTTLQIRRRIYLQP